MESHEGSLFPDEGPYAAQSEVSVMSDCPHYCTLGENFDPPIRKGNSFQPVYIYFI